MSNPSSDGGRGGLAFDPTSGSYDYSGNQYYEDDENNQRVSSLPTAEEERKLLDEDGYNEEYDEGRAVVTRDQQGGTDNNDKSMAPDQKYKERRHDRVIREGMSYKDAMMAVHLDRERVELEKELNTVGGTGAGGYDGGSEKGESVAVVSRWDEDSASSAPRR
jgi:hypothetical protein